MDQYVVCDDDMSDVLPFNVEVSQGSVLATLLFNICINEIAFLNLEWKMCFFADEGFNIV